MAYERQGFAQPAILSMRKRWGPLEQTMIPNHAVLAFEGELKNRSLKIITDSIPHGSWSPWTGLVFEGHDSMVVQCPNDPKLIAYTQEVIKYAMHYEYNGMIMEGDDPMVMKTLGDL